MDIRAVFEQVKAHLLQQKECARSEGGGSCVYLDPDTGRKCAVGCLIKPEFYDPSLEGSGIGPFSGDTAETERIREAVCKSLGIEKLEPGDIELLRGLQTIHDSYPPADWSGKLDAIERTL